MIQEMDVDELSKLHAEFGAVGSKALEGVRKTALWIKIAFVLVPSFISAALISIQAQGDGKWTLVHIGAVVGAICAIAFGVFSIWLDRKETKTDGLCERALAEAMRVQATLKQFQSANLSLESSVKQYVATNTVVSNLSGILESGAQGSVQIEALMERAFSATRSDLLKAFRFQPSDTWSVLLYRPKQIDGQMVMVCCAQARSFDCPLKDARKFPQGVGIPGFVFANKSEKVVGDLQDPAYVKLHELPEGMKKPTDTNTRSVACVPIRISSGEIWGAVAATCSNPNHFSNDGVGQANVEVLRVVACVLAIATLMNHKE